MAALRFRTALKNGLLEPLGVHQVEKQSLHFHLSILATHAEIDANTALMRLLENPYWQYFCGFQTFQYDLEKETRKFRAFSFRISENNRYGTRNTWLR